MRTRSHTVVLFCLSLCLLISLNACSSDDLSSPQHNTGVKIEEDVLAPPTLVSLRLEPAKPLPWRPVACLYQVKVPKGAEDVSAHQWYVDDQPVAAGAGGKLSADAFGPGAEVRCQVDPATKTGATAETTSVQARALGARMIKDLETQGADTGTAVLAHLGDTVLIQVWMNQQPGALWGAREDGTDPKLLHPSAPLASMAIEGLLFFLSGEAQDATELWRSDGTPQGTSLLKQWPLSEETKVRTLHALGPERVLITTWSDAEKAQKLWVSDGSKAGTTLLQMEPGTWLDTGFGILQGPDQNWYVLGHKGADLSLWRIDSSSLHMSKAVGLGALTADNAQVRGLWILGRKIVLATLDGLYTKEHLWAWDLLAGGEPVVVETLKKERDYSPLFSNSIQVGDTFLFWRQEGSEPGSVWAIDTTKGGGRELPKAFGSSTLRELIVLGGIVYGWGEPEPELGPWPPGARALWRSDGTPEGTFALYHFSAVSSPITLASESGVVPWQGKIYFIGQNADHGAELWVTDGTRQGTTLALDTEPGPGHGPSWLWTATEDALYYLRPDSTLWKTDGTLEGTSQVFGRGHGVDLERWTPPFVTGSRLFFSRETQEHGQELWVSDGSREGTRIVRDFNPRTRDLQSTYAALVGGELHFGRDSYFGSLWRHRGEELVELEFAQKGEDDFRHRSLGVLDDALMFQVAHGQEPRKTSFWALRQEDSSPIPATMLPQVENLEELSLWSLGTKGHCAETFPMGGHWHHKMPQEAWKEVSWLPEGAKMKGQPLVFNETMMLVSEDKVTKENVLWANACDGSPARELIRLKTLLYLDPYQVHSTAKHFYFFVRDSDMTELWRTDGTAQGTQKVAPVIVIVKGTEDYRPVGHAGDDFYFGTIVPSDPPKSIYEDGERQLWVVKGSDPTPIKLGVFQDIWGLGEGSAVGNVVYFGADDGIHGAELWRSDGTAKGTRMVRDMVPGPQGARPNGAKVFLGLLWFSATTAAGSELWVSDGTQEGTLLFQDIYPGAPSSTPSLMLGDEQRLYFLADDGIHGREWWVME